MVAFYASRSHYADHLAPIAEVFGLPVLGSRSEVPPGTVVVASYLDLWAFRGRRAVLVEHGAGQAYGGSHPAYSGGRSRENAVLFVVPSEEVAARNRERYPSTPNAVVGSPRLDRWHADPPEPGREIGLAFHWFVGGIAPEARSAFPHHASALEPLRRRFGERVLGTGHPRAEGRLRKAYGAAGIPFVSTDEVFRRARVLVVDNSSVGWEFASLDRPIVWLNAPWYRRDVEFGLRFWGYADAGILVDEPEDVPDAVALALEDPEPYRSRRRDVIENVYAYRDGKAAIRAAEAIEEVA